MSFKKIMLSTESHYSAKAPQNMRYKERNKFKKTFLFQIYHSLIFFEKCTLFTIFVNFYDLWLYFAFDAKIKVYKRNLWSRWFFGMKVHYIRSVYSKYLFEIFFQLFTIFGYILPLTQKLRCTKEIYDLDDYLAWK